MMDQNHINLIASLVTCSKPSSILELGIGSGAVTRVLMDSADYNQRFNNQMFTAITCVDNFLDWGGVEPRGIAELPVDLVVSSERDFIASYHRKFDLIVSDASHEHAHEWMNKVFSILNPRGVIIHHDVMNPDYPNLRLITERVIELGWSHVVFDKSSRQDERCWRGLLVAFKPNES